MGRTTIEWVRNPDGTQGYSLNPIKGKCPMACPYCYARRMYDRFKWNPEIRFDQRVLWEFCDHKNLPPSKVFVGSTMELFGEWVKPEWLENILAFCKWQKQHTFVLLTKQPQNLIKWSPFPDNCWVGVTATDYYAMFKALNALAYLDGGIQAKVKFISFEPLLESVAGPRLNLSGVNWVIIGAQTKPYKPPKIEWVEEIAKAADEAGIPVFLKDNLAPALEVRKPFIETTKNYTRYPRQEMPLIEIGR